MQTAPPPLYCLPGRGHALDPYLSPRPHPDPLGVTASPSSLFHLHTRLQDHLPVQLLPLPTVRPQGVPASHHDQQREARTKQDWLSSGSISPSSLSPMLPCVCPMLPIFILCLLPKKESRQLLALSTWNQPRTVFSFQV